MQKMVTTGLGFGRGGNKKWISNQIWRENKKDKKKERKKEKKKKERKKTERISSFDTQSLQKHNQYQKSDVINCQHTFLPPAIRNYLSRHVVVVVFVDDSTAKQNIRYKWQACNNLICCETKRSSKIY